ncbi:hypothetical protein HDN1F_10040 [gamma proteobacterium HdN1]|nr:hypothetical protein HDN1F_10040 [gamma proteobacterium HdN1]
MSASPRVSARIVLIAVLLAACSAMTLFSGRYIVYLTPDVSLRVNTPDERSQLVAIWQQEFEGKITFERVLATGGWLVRVEGFATSQAALQQALRGLTGVADVELDAKLQIVY